VAAIAAGWWARALAPFGTVIVAGAAATLLLFAFSWRSDNSAFYDVYWSVAPALCAGYWLTVMDGWTRPRALLVASLALVWGARLTSNWVKHWPGLDHEDWRYVNLRKQSGRWYWPASFVALHLFPFTVVSLGSLPIALAIASTRPLGVLDAIAAAVTLAAVAIEARADVELHRFMRDNRDPKVFLATGLWSWSRHPNYFGEASFWWGLWLCALAAGHAPWWSALGAAAVTSMILFASIPMAERRMIAKRPAYREHQARVSRLIPLPPRRATASRGSS
jgi:steroid 5-alpha reductase family enzyme